MKQKLKCLIYSVKITIYMNQDMISEFLCISKHGLMYPVCVKFSLLLEEYA